MESRTVRICRAGDHLSAKVESHAGYAERERDRPLRISRQMRPSLSMRDRAERCPITETCRRTDIRVIDLCQEAHLGRCHRVLFWKEQLQAKYAVCA